MFEPIEFYDTPDKANIILEFNDGKSKRYRCSVDISHNNTISEVYNKDDEVIATNLQDLKALGVVSAYLEANHEIEM